MLIPQKEDTPKCWTFKEDPNNPSYYAIYTIQKKSEALDAESELPTVVQDTIATKERAVGSQELVGCSTVTISLVTKVVNDVPPRSNTIVGEECKESYIFDVRFTVPMVSRKVFNFVTSYNIIIGLIQVPISPPKEPLSKNQECQPPTTSESSEKLTIPDAPSNEEGSVPTDSNTG